MAQKTKNLEKNLEKGTSEEAEVPEQPDVEPPTKKNKTEPKKKVAKKRKTEPKKKTILTKEERIAKDQPVRINEPEKKKKMKKKENEEHPVGKEGMRGTCSQTVDPTPNEEGTRIMDEATGTGNQALNPAEHASSEADAMPQVQEEEDEHIETPAEHSNAEGEEIPQVVEDENEQMKTAAEQQTVIEQRKKKKRKRKRKTKDKEKRKKKTTTESMEEQQEIVEGDQTPIEEGSGNRTGEQTFPGEHANPAVEPNPVEEK